MTSEQLKAERKARSLTQGDFAAWLGCSKSTVVSWENDRNPIPDWAVARLKSDRPVIKHTLSADQIQKMAEKATAAGMTVEQWVDSLIVKAISLALLCALAPGLLLPPCGA